MFIDVCEEFVGITKEIVKSGMDFTMWTDTFNGNVGINIKNENGDLVDVSQYMSPYTDNNGEMKVRPIGLSILYKTRNGSKRYDEGCDVESFIKEIKTFLQTNK